MRVLPDVLFVCAMHMWICGCTNGVQYMSLCVHKNVMKKNIKLYIGGV